MKHYNRTNHCYIRDFHQVGQRREWLKKKNPNICSNMGGPWDYHTKWSKLGRESQILYHFMRNLKNSTNEYIYETETDSQNRRQIYSYQRWKREKYKLGVWD